MTGLPRGPLPRSHQQHWLSDEAVRVARQRFDNGCWSELPPVIRIDVLLKLADLIGQHQGELALLDTLEMGKPIKAALYDAHHLAPPIAVFLCGIRR